MSKWYVQASNRKASFGWKTFAKGTTRDNAYDLASVLTAHPETKQVIITNVYLDDNGTEQETQYIWHNADVLGYSHWDVFSTLNPEPEEECPHGLSLWLCADPINHYPADNQY